MIYWNRILLRTTHLPDDFSLYNNAIISVSKWVSYLNRILVRTIHLSDDFSLYDKAIISASKWVSYLNRILIKTIHLSCDVRLSNELTNIPENEYFIRIQLLSTFVTFKMICNNVIWFRFLFLKWLLYWNTSLLKII